MSRHAPGPWIALLTLGSFCVLASFAYGRAAPTVRHAGHVARPVNVIAYREDVCGIDWLCLLAWAERPHAKERRIARK